MTGMIERITIYLRERRFRRSLRPGAVTRLLKVPYHASNHGARGTVAAAMPAAVEDAIDAWGTTTLGERHQLAAAGVGHAASRLEKCRFGAAEKGYSNVLQRFAAKVKTILADTEGRLRDTQAKFSTAATELVRHCAEIAAPLVMAYRERTDGLWTAFAGAISLDAFAGAVATADELGWALSMVLAGVLGAVVFIFGCGAGWARQQAWVRPRLGWTLVLIDFAIVTAVILAFCRYRLTLADLAAETAGVSGPEAAAAAAAIPPLVLLLAVAGWAAWFWTMRVWLGIYGVAPGVRARAIRSKRAAAECHRTVDQGRTKVLAAANVADGEIDQACGEAAARRTDAVTFGVDVVTRGEAYDRERESVFAVWGAAHGEFAGIVSQVANTPRASREIPGDFPIIATDYVPAIVSEVQNDADTLMLDEGRAKLAIAATCTAALRELDRMKGGLPSLSPQTELIP